MEIHLIGAGNFNRALIAYTILFVAIGHSLQGQENPKWDDQKSKDWPEEMEIISIVSTLDNKAQPAYYYSSKKSHPQPLIVSLHTWSGGFDQKDPLAWQCIEKDYNYIHPHFRGPNNNFEACGSELAIQDIDDAIAYAVKNGNVDTCEIHVIGVSGGGYASLLSYMKSQHRISTFSAWVPISDLKEWYYQSEGRKNKYAKDVALSTTKLTFEGEDYFIDADEAKKRSPIYMETPVKKRVNSKLYIYAGIHDGYTGSVPISQSLRFYNKVVRSFDQQFADTIPEKDMIRLLAARNFHPERGDTIGGRAIHYQKQYKNLVSLTIFEGSHEMLEALALDHIPGVNILTIGDSNGAMTGGWVDQLAKIRFNDHIYNTSIGGNTIGFDNGGRAALNSLKNIDRYLSNAREKLGSVDFIICMLGTNDCKSVFKDSMDLVTANFSRLLLSITSHPLYINQNPRILIVSPPPIGKGDVVDLKYPGGNKRLELLIPQLRNIAETYNCYFIPTHFTLLPNFEDYTSDGVHLNDIGQKRIASEINTHIHGILQGLR